MPDQAEQFLVGVRLSKIVVDTQFDRVVTVLLGNARSDHDDGKIAQRGIGTDIARQVEAVHARHLDVRQHHRGTLFLQAFKRLQTVGSERHAVALTEQQTLCDAAHGD